MDSVRLNYTIEEQSLHKAHVHKQKRLLSRALRLSIFERRLMLTVVDLALINAVLVVTLALRTKFVTWAPPLLDSSKWFATLLANTRWFVTLSVIWLMWANVFNCYDLARAARPAAILPASAGVAFMTATVYTFIPLFTPPLQSRGLIFVFVGLMMIGSVGWRAIYAHLFDQSWSKQLALVVVGAGRHLAVTSKLVSADANPFHGTGYQVVGLVADHQAESLEDGSDLPLLGGIHQLVHLARQHRVDEIVVTFDNERAISPETYEVLLDCRELGLQVNTLATVYERLTGRLSVDYARRDLDLILGPANSPASRLYAGLKRLLDVVLALLGLVVLALLIPWVALGNTLCSSGPLFYRQQRMGKGGRPFAMLKFRSMIPHAEQATGTVWCDEEDLRVTPVGHWLRKTHLDELPQVINVLRGEMSIVGPRPERPHFVGQLARTLPLYRARHAVKPGITGWAQVCYGYGNSVEDSRVKLEYDLYYVKHASFYLDLLILLHTVRAMLGFMGQ